MATSEALIKYYDCLKDSFSKIQDKSNETALINAALRPKIREEFAKSQDVLTSYLNYIQVFSIIYNEKFSTICTNIIVPLLKEHDVNIEELPNFLERTKKKPKKGQIVAFRIHHAFRVIVKSKDDLASDLVASIAKVFPNLYSDDNEEGYTKFFKNSLVACTYVNPNHLNILITKLLQRLNPPPPKSHDDSFNLERFDRILRESFEIMYDFIDTLTNPDSSINGDIAERFISTFLENIVRDYQCLQSFNTKLNFLILYICSKDQKYSDTFINSLWEVFVDTNKSQDERIVSVNFISSFMSRASFIDIDKVIEYLEKSTRWCLDFLAGRSDKRNDDSQSSLEYFYALTQSIFYLLSQRYREIYEEETIDRIKKMNFDEILADPTKPLENCNPDVQQRFREVATLQHLANPQTVISSAQANKKRKFDSNSSQHIALWRIPYRETCDSPPKRVKSLYRNYYDHRNFTVYRE